MRELTLLRVYGKRLVAIALVAAMYGLTRPRTLSPDHRAILANRFSFRSTLLPTISHSVARTIRTVNPSLRDIAAWISAVGAAVALNDLDANGLSDDVCYVDVRSDQVIVAPVPGTGSRYVPFLLEPSPLPYDAATMAPMGCLPGDFNEDGKMDLLVYYWGRTPVLFLSAPNVTGMSKERFVPHELVRPFQRWYSNAAVQTDLDGDGHGDFVIGNYFPDGAHVLDAHSSLPEHMQHSMSRAENGGRMHLLRWTPSGFIDESAALNNESAYGWTLGVGAADLDGDLLPELYFARDFGPDRLLHNRSTPGHLRFALLEGRRRFTTPASKVLGHDSHKGMSVDFADINGDGLPDICVDNIADEYALEESHFLFVSTGHASAMRHGEAPYVDESETLGLSRGGWGWDCRFGDFDNDGTLELVRATGFVKGDVNRWPELQELAMGNDELLARSSSWPRFTEGIDISGHEHPRFFVRDSSGRFFDVATSVGLGEEQVSRGIATADVDGDGRLDIAIANQWETSRFYHNESEHVAAFFGLRLTLLEDSGVRRPALTATVSVHLPDGRITTSQIDGGNGHSGKRSYELHFGLGNAAEPHRDVAVDLHWRDEHGAIHKGHTVLGPGWHSITLRGEHVFDGETR